MLQLTRQWALLYIRLGQVDSIIPKPMRRAIAEVVLVVHKRLRHHRVIRHSRLQNTLVIHPITLVIEHHDVVFAAAFVILSGIALEDDVPHLAVALGLEVDNVLNPHPIEVRFRLIALLLRGQVADENTVDFGLKILPSLLFPHLRLVEPFETVRLPVGGIARIIEEIVKCRVLPVKDARELFENQLAYWRTDDRIAEQSTERLELLLRQEVLDESHKVRFGGRVSHLHRLVDMEFQPVLVTYCFHNHASLRPPLQPFTYLLFRNTHRV